MAIEVDVQLFAPMPDRDLVAPESARAPHRRNVGDARARRPAAGQRVVAARKPIGKQADQTDGASGGCHPGRPGRNPAPRTSARSNGTTSFSTASTSSIVPGSAKERVLMLYFNTNVGATLARRADRRATSPTSSSTASMSSIADSSGGRAHGLSVQNRTDLPDTLYGIETFPQETIVERIDRGMFVIGELGAIAFLLIALGL